MRLIECDQCKKQEPAPQDVTNLHRWFMLQYGAANRQMVHFCSLQCLASYVEGMKQQFIPSEQP